MTAFRASYADLKVIKTRQCVQVIFELPISDFDAAYEVLGGLPDSSSERWFGIAAIAAQTARAEKRDWRDLQPQQQAGIRCEEPTFTAFLREQRPDDWHESASDPAECIRLICGVKSRSELGTNHKARVIWKQLDDAFQAWKSLEHA